MDVKIGWSIARHHVKLGQLPSKWSESATACRLIAYFSTNTHAASDTNACCAVALDDSSTQLLYSSCIRSPAPSAQLRFELLCTVRTAEGRACRHRLGVSGILLRNIRTESSSVELVLKEPRAADNVGSVHITVCAHSMPPTTALDGKTPWYLGDQIFATDTLASAIAKEQLQEFYTPELTPAHTALNSIHCPLQGKTLPGGWLASIRPCESSDEHHMLLCFQYGCDMAEIDFDTFVRYTTAQLKEPSKLLPTTRVVLCALASAAVVLASLTPYCVDHALNGKRNRSEGGLGCEAFDCSRGAVHGTLPGGGDCEDKAVTALCFCRDLVNGPGHHTQPTVWSHPVLAAAQRVTDAWYRPGTSQPK